MQTPNTPRSRETERLMLLWRKQNPDADTSTYNREWDSVYRKLEGFMEPRYIVKDDGFYPVPCSLIQGSSDDPPPTKIEPRRRRHKHAPQTKGAFGKPKHPRRR